MVTQRVTLLAAFRRVKRRSAALHRITHAIRFRAPTPLPKRMERKSATVLRPREHGLRHDCKSAAHAGEPAVLGKTAQFNCAVARARNFENGMRNIWLRNIRLVQGNSEHERLLRALLTDS